MKRIFIIALCMLLLLLCGCSGISGEAARKDVFPAGTTAFGIDLSEETPEEADALFRDFLKNYVLIVETEDGSIPITGEAVGLEAVGVDFAELRDICEKRQMQDLTDLIVLAVNEQSFPSVVAEKLGAQACDKDIELYYDEGSNRFAVRDVLLQGNTPSAGKLSKIKDAVIGLQERVSLDSQETAVSLKETAEKANSMLELELVYYFCPKGGNPSEETIGRELIQSWLVVSEDGQSIVIDANALGEYVSLMDERYTITDGYSNFLTSNGNYVSLSIPREGQQLDTAALFEDISNCILNLTGGNRDALYQSSSTNGLTYEGTYVEIDLDNQYVWYYLDGELILETKCVTGCCNEGNWTPSGVYTIYNKATDTYLVGEDYKTHVDYWMAFNYGIGLHDATWRSSFGGTIYYYNGSHGCVNLPHDIAKKLYEYTTVGTHVIVYGSAKSVEPLSNSINGTSSLTLQIGDTVVLDAAAAHKASLTYSSSDSAVVSVTKEGMVTALRPGTAVITVTSKDVQGYKSASFNVTIKVEGTCSSGNHSWDYGTITQSATCSREGERTYTCSLCGATKTESISKTNHSWFTSTTDPTCGMDGRVEAVCTECGASKDTEYIPATGDHFWVDGVCHDCGMKNPDFGE